MFGLDPFVVSAFAQVIMIDLVLAGDNAIVTVLAAAGLPEDLRRQAIPMGIAAATLMRIGFALIATQLFAVTGLLLAGGPLLLWVCWRMCEELRVSQREELAAVEEVAGQDLSGDGTIGGSVPRKTLRQAVTQIIVADAPMSLDNVWAVAGAAQEHPGVLVFGLVLSVAQMGAASSYIARPLNRFHWIACVGLLVILYVAIKMCSEAFHELSQVMFG